VPLIVVSRSIGEDAAIAALKEGAADYLLKDRLARLGEAIKQALEQKRLREEKRRAEEALREREEELLQARKLEAIGRLAGGVAHDFNNLLTIITGHSEMALCGLGPDDPLRGTIGEIVKASERAAALTRQLLAFGRRQVLQPVTLDLNALLADTQSMLRRLIREDVELRLRPGAGLWPIRADAGKLEQVMMNLILNARDAMPSGGQLTVETRNVELTPADAAGHAEAAAGEFVLLAVTDTGHGMSAAVNARVFEPFFTTKEQGKGKGLGLATVYGIVKQSGGRIELHSTPGQGTTFKIYFPRDWGNSPAATSLPGRARSGRGKETVLLVEDEDAVRALARLVLVKNGYAVLEAPSGGEALRLAEKHAGPIYLLITDVVMPCLSGPQVPEAVVRLRPNTKVLYLSSSTDDALAHHGVLNSDMPLLLKPFGPEALAKKVREVLDA